VWHDVLENVVAILDCVQQRERKAAGEPQVPMSFGS
jgi:hypothetical protein